VPLCISYTDADSGLLFAGMYETRWPLTLLQWPCDPEMPFCSVSPERMQSLDWYLQIWCIVAGDKVCDTERMPIFYSFLQGWCTGMGFEFVKHKESASSPRTWHYFVLFSNSSCTKMWFFQIPETQLNVLHSKSTGTLTYSIVDLDRLCTSPVISSQATFS
jgi:hypothetical protein